MLTVFQRIARTPRKGRSLGTSDPYAGKLPSAVLWGLSGETHRPYPTRHQSPHMSITIKEPTPEPAATEIDAKTQDLIREFVEHARSFQAQYPGEHDPRKIFESWAIQKIAALQYTVLQLGDELVNLRKQISRRR